VSDLILYFGCIGGPGHYLHGPATRRAEKQLRAAGIYPAIDGGYCPGVDPNRKHAWQLPERQVEGEAALHHVGGWTILAFWDRSVDSRMGCNSAFLLRGEATFGEMVELSRREWPEVWSRFTFRVVEAKR
jgi:hypothetical protein